MAENTFYTDRLAYEEVQTKSGKEYYVTGYISTPEPDLLNDVVTDACLDDMFTQIKNRTLKMDLDHEAWREGTPDKMPLGKAVDCKRDTKGVFVKTRLNENWKQFNTKGEVVQTFPEVWASVKNGYYDAFSMAYKPVEIGKKQLNDKTLRVLNKVNLLNYGLTGNPANPNCKMVDVFTKNLENIKAEENKMSEAEIDSIRAEIKSLSEQNTKFSEELKSLQASKEELVLELKSLKESAELKNKEFAEAIEAKNVEIKNMNASLDNPVFKAHLKNLELSQQAAAQRANDKVKGPLDLI